MVVPHGIENDHPERGLRVRVLSRMAVAPPRPGESGPTGVLNRICRTIVTDLGVTGAAVNLMDGPSHAQAVVGRSDQVSAAVDELQFSLGEGPCHDAARTGRPVHSSDLANDTRWPGYSAAAEELDVRSVYAFPLQVGAVSLGVLDVYDSHPLVLDEEAWKCALAYADIATETLLHTSDADASFIDPGLRTALGSRSQIYQAQGMIRIDQDVPLGEALVRLRAFAYGNGRAIADVARDIVEGGLLLPTAGDT